MRSAIRHTERYKCLADPRNRSAFFDSLKYVPLSASDPSRYLSFGGEIRGRYDCLHLNQRVRVFAQAMSGLVRGLGGRDINYVGGWITVTW